MKKITIGLAILAAIVGVAGISAFKSHRAGTTALKSHFNALYWYTTGGTYVNEDSEPVELNYCEDEYPSDTFNTTGGTDYSAFEYGYTTKSFGGTPAATIYVKD
jgi:hypothetical protein